MVLPAMATGAQAAEHAPFCRSRSHGHASSRALLENVSVWPLLVAGQSAGPPTGQPGPSPSGPVPDTWRKCARLESATRNSPSWLGRQRGAHGVGDHAVRLVFGAGHLQRSLDLGIELRSARALLALEEGRTQPALLGARAPHRDVDDRRPERSEQRRTRSGCSVTSVSIPRSVSFSSAACARDVEGADLLER